MSRLDSTETASTGLAEYKGVWGREQAIHLLKRTMFGASPNDVSYFAKRTMVQAVDELLDTVPDTAPPLNDYQATLADPTGVKLGETWVNAARFDDLNKTNGARTSSYRGWWVGKILNQNRSIHEKMALFWHNHFSTEISVIGDAILAYIHNATLRKYATGNFKSLTKAITLDPAMLIYLNGQSSSKTAPDENYARELQELFTIGKSPQSKYSEDDVKAAAKVLTGYQIDRTKNTYVFNASRHDTTDKQFSAFYKSTIVKGQTGANGEKELDELLNMIFAQNEVSLFLARKLYRYFVFYTIDDIVEKNVIAPLAQILRDYNYEIKPALSKLLKSEHFFDVLNVGAMIKSPVDLVAGVAREFGAQVADTKDIASVYDHWRALFSQLTIQQQELHEPPNVAGWPCYYQSPAYYRIWINSDTFPKKTQFTDTFFVAGYRNGTNKVILDPLLLTSLLPNPEDPVKLVKDAVQLLYRIDLAADEMTRIKKDYLLSGQTSDYYWTDAWNAYIANPKNAMAVTTVKTRLKNMYQFLLSLPEFQLM